MTNTYFWDAWNRLAEVKEGVTTLTSFEYDGLNHRIRNSIRFGWKL